MSVYDLGECAWTARDLAPPIPMPSRRRRITVTLAVDTRAFDQQVAIARRSLRDVTPRPLLWLRAVAVTAVLVAALAVETVALYKGWAG